MEFETKGVLAFWERQYNLPYNCIQKVLSHIFHLFVYAGYDILNSDTFQYTDISLQ
jgi:hypothetical protein